MVFEGYGLDRHQGGFCELTTLRINSAKDSGS
jgi:hypothetical protein